MNNVPIFEHTDTGFKKPEKTHVLSDTDYSAALSTFVFACVDILVTTNEGIMLVKRKLKPGAGNLWFIGGRMAFGESVKEATARIFARETRLFVGPEKFKLVTIALTRWGDREQEPQNAGAHQVVFCHHVHLDQNMLCLMHFDQKEYESEGQVFIPNSAWAEKLTGSQLHPYVRNVILMVAK